MTELTGRGQAGLVMTVLVVMGAIFLDLDMPSAMWVSSVAAGFWSVVTIFSE